MFAGLPELGISNGDDLKETLTNCTEPLKAIDQFQVLFVRSLISLSLARKHGSDADTSNLNIVIIIAVLLKLNAA